MRWPILDAIPIEQARAVLAVARRSSLQRGEPVFHEGDAGNSLYLLEKGKVAIRVTTPLGDVATLRILSAGDFFGELAVIAPGRRNATVVALEDVEVLSIHKDQIERLRGQNPGVDQVLISALVAEVRRLSSQLLHAMYVPLPQRVAQCLLDLADAYALKPGPVTIPLTQEDIAGLCGASRPSTNQVLKALQAEGSIELARGKVVVLDQHGLKDATE